MRIARFALGAVAVVMLSVAAPGGALAANAQDSAVAQSLYDDATKLMNDSKFGDACPKLEESQRLDPQQVTEFKLGECYEKLGRTASAWTTFLDLAEVARKANRPDRERAARDRASLLEPKLTRLTIEVPAAVRVTGLVVKRDNEVVGEGQYGVAIPVDPGKHVVEASAPGKKTWNDSRVVSGEGATSSLKVEALVDDTSGGTAGTATATGAGTDQPSGGEKKGSPLKTVGIVIGAVGIAGIGVGAVTGIMAISKNNDANSNQGCDKTTNICTSSAGVSERSDAVTFGNVSTVGFIVGGVLLAGGATLWLLAPSSSVQAAPAVGTNGGGIVLRGRF